MTNDQSSNISIASIRLASLVDWFDTRTLGEEGLVVEGLLAPFFSTLDLWGDEKDVCIHLDPRRREGSNSDARQTTVSCTPTMPVRG